MQIVARLIAEESLHALVFVEKDSGSFLRGYRATLADHIAPKHELVSGKRFDDYADTETIIGVAVVQREAIREEPKRCAALRLRLIEHDTVLFVDLMFYLITARTTDWKSSATLRASSSDAPDFASSPFQGLK